MKAQQIVDVREFIGIFNKGLCLLSLEIDGVMAESNAELVSFCYENKELVVGRVAGEEITFN